MALGALANSPYGRMLNPVPWYSPSKGDYLHTNSIDVSSGEQAAGCRSPRRPVLLSLREIGAIALLDLEREQIVWALAGRGWASTAPTSCPNGHLLLFDNEGD